MTVAIDVRGVGKRYHQLEERTTLLTSMVPFLRTSKKEQWALRDVSFAIERGETVGVLGRNGAGKTTLLRLLAGVTRPTEGRLTVRGRVAPLISVGVGFHGELSGRENVYVNGMLLGLTRHEISERFDQITSFAELDDYIDTPVKFYSTGMAMRLGFSVAVHADPDVLLVDEVLAVGDIAFQLKCFEHMRELQRRGATIVLVSHSMHAIRLLCPRALLIRSGRMEIDSTTEEAIARHHELMSFATDKDGTQPDDAPRAVDIVSRHLVGPDGITHHPRADDSLVYQVSLRFHAEVDSPQVNFHVSNEDGTLVYNLISTVGRQNVLYPAGSEATVDIAFKARLGGGTYRLRVTVFDRNGRDILAYDSTGYLMYLAPQEGVGGIADLRAAISIDGRVVSDHAKLMMLRGDD